MNPNKLFQTHSSSLTFNQTRVTNPTLALEKESRDLMQYIPLNLLDTNHTKQNSHAYSHAATKITIAHRKELNILIRSTSNELCFKK